MSERMGAAVGGEPIRVVVVDDHAMFREGIILLLSKTDDILVCAQGATGVDAVSLVAQLTPDAVLLDVDLPGSVAETTVRTLRRTAPGTAVVIVTMHDDPVLRRQLLTAGAAAYVVKEADADALAASIRAAVEEQRTHRDQQTDEQSHADAVAGLAPEPAVSILSPREHEVMRLVAMAMSNAMIADRLKISEGTVKRHTSSIYAKLGAVSRIDATRRAQRLGLV